MRRFLPFLFILFCSELLIASDEVFDLAAEYNQKKNDVVNLESEKRKILAEIYQIEKENNKIEIQKTELQENKFKLDQELKEISRKIVEIELELTELTPLLSKRVEFVEHINKLPWFYTFITSQSLSDLDRMIESANRINSQQADQITQFAVLVDELKNRKADLRKTAIEIVKVRKEITKKEKDVSSNQVVKNKILKRLETNIKKEKASLLKLRGAGKKAVAESGMDNLGLLFGTDFFNKKGELPRPVEGILVQPYGLNVGLTEDKIQLLHKGHFYETGPDQKVRSVAPGKIKFAGSVEGFGQVVIVDHGGRYYTTYANLSGYLVSADSEVKEKEPIGKTGQNHLQLGIGLYFEIRHFSQPQDPGLWLEKGSKQLANL